MYEKNYQQLGYAIALQAAKDYVSTKSKTSHTAILRCLRHDNIALITSGVSPILADKLEKELKQIKRRIIQMRKEIHE